MAKGTYTSTHWNPPEPPSGTYTSTRRNSPEPSGTFFRNLLLRPAPVAYAVGENKTAHENHESTSFLMLPEASGPPAQRLSHCHYRELYLANCTSFADDLSALSKSAKALSSSQKETPLDRSTARPLIQITCCRGTVLDTLSFLSFLSFLSSLSRRK